MIEVAFSNSFKKAFTKRVQNKNSESIFWKKLEYFISDPFHSSLKTHKLTGKLKGSWSFSVEYDLRIVLFYARKAA